LVSCRSGDVHPVETQRIRYLLHIGEVNSDLQDRPYLCHEARAIDDELRRRCVLLFDVLQPTRWPFDGVDEALEDRDEFRERPRE
jgi:hypothetical protein